MWYGQWLKYKCGAQELWKNLEPNCKLKSSSQPARTINGCVGLGTPAGNFRGPGTAFPRVPPYFNHTAYMASIVWHYVSELDLYKNDDQWRRYWKNYFQPHLLLPDNQYRRLVIDCAAFKVLSRYFERFWSLFMLSVPHQSAPYTAYMLSTSCCTLGSRYHSHTSDTRSRAQVHRYRFRCAQVCISRRAASSSIRD